MLLVLGYVVRAGGPTGDELGVAGDRGADLLTRDDPGDVPLVGEVEDDHVDVVVAGQARRRGIGDLEAAVEELVVGQVVELDRLGVVLRVGVVDAVDALLAHQDDLGTDL